SSTSEILHSLNGFNVSVSDGVNTGNVETQSDRHLVQLSNENEFRSIDIDLGSDISLINSDLLNDFSSNFKIPAPLSNSDIFTPSPTTNGTYYLTHSVNGVEADTTGNVDLKEEQISGTRNDIPTASGTVNLDWNATKVTK